MKKFTFQGDLSPEEMNQRIMLKPFQKISVLCTFLYGIFWLKFDSLFELEVDAVYFILTSILVAALIPITFIYNLKYEQRYANRWMCNLMALFAAGSFFYRIIKMGFL